MTVRDLVELVVTKEIPADAVVMVRPISGTSKATLTFVGGESVGSVGSVGDVEIPVVDTSEETVAGIDAGMLDYK